MTSTSSAGTDRTDYVRPDARLHLNAFQPFGPIYEWSRTPDPLDFYSLESYIRLAQDAERGLFTALFLGESLRLREHLGVLNDIAVTGRPDALTLFASLAAHTNHLGLVATLNTTYTDPIDLARRIRTVDVLSGGRAGWNIVTTDNGWTGENFRRGGFLAREDRYTYAETHVSAVQRLWDEADAASPRSPQGQAVYFQAGDSDEGRDFAARWAEGIFTHHVEFDEAVEFTADIRRRARAQGRSGDDIAVFPGARIVVAPTAAEAEEKARHLRELALSDRRVYQIIESVWQEDLSHVDLDGPLPSADPDAERQSRTHGIVHTGHEPTVKAREWRAIAEERGFSIRQLAHHLTETRSFVGTPGAVADELAHHVRSDAFDGLNVAPDAFPDGLGDIVELLVPALQERGVYPTEYPGARAGSGTGSDTGTGSTLRQVLELPREPALLGRRAAVGA